MVSLMRPSALTSTLFGLLTLLGSVSTSLALEHQRPRIAIVIDDLGNSATQSRFVELPGEVTLAVLPFAPHAQEVANYGSQHGKEVIIHMPMQPLHAKNAGPGMLSVDLERQQFRAIVQQALAHIPNAKGVNNHMGSKLTAQARQMRWLMSELTHKNLYYLDSRTTAATLAEQAAWEAGLPVARRHVFLDNDPSEQAIIAEWMKLIAHAKEHGSAIAIGHPYESTYRVLREQLPSLLEEHGIDLVYASKLTRQRATKKETKILVAPPAAAINE